MRVQADGKLPYVNRIKKIKCNNANMKSWNNKLFSGLQALFPQNYFFSFNNQHFCRIDAVCQEE